jgi:hypothetical protein
MNCGSGRLAGFALGLLVIMSLAPVSAAPAAGLGPETAVGARVVVLLRAIRRGEGTFGHWCAVERESDAAPLANVFTLRDVRPAARLPSMSGDACDTAEVKACGGSAWRAKSCLPAARSRPRAPQGPSIA